MKEDEDDSDGEEEEDGGKGADMDWLRDFFLLFLNLDYDSLFFIIIFFLHFTLSLAKFLMRHPLILCLVYICGGVDLLMFTYTLDDVEQDRGK